MQPPQPKRPGPSLRTSHARQAKRPAAHLLSHDWPPASAHLARESSASTEHPNPRGRHSSARALHSHRSSPSRSARSARRAPRSAAQMARQRGNRQSCQRREDPCRRQSRRRRESRRRQCPHGWEKSRTPAARPRQECRRRRNPASRRSSGRSTPFPLHSYPSSGCHRCPPGSEPHGTSLPNRRIPRRIPFTGDRRSSPPPRSAARPCRPLRRPPFPQWSASRPAGNRKDEPSSK